MSLEQVRIVRGSTSLIINVGYSGAVDGSIVTALVEGKEGSPERYKKVRLSRDIATTHPNNNRSSFFELRRSLPYLTFFSVHYEVLHHLCLCPSGPDRQRPHHPRFKPRSPEAPDRIRV